MGALAALYIGLFIWCLQKNKEMKEIKSRLIALSSIGGAHILLAIILGVAVGLGKELFYRPAGFRVSVIVTISSCLITLVGVYALPEALSAIIGGMIITGGLLTLGIINNNRGDYNGLVSACMVILCTVIGVTAASGL